MFRRVWPVLASGSAAVALLAATMLTSTAHADEVRREEVRTYVSMGSPQYGHPAACLLGEQDGGQMCPFGGFLHDLNDGDDTPGEVAYTTIRSTRDPADATRLDGGACFHEIVGVEHPEEPRSPQFISAALAAVGGNCPGAFVNLPGARTRTTTPTP